MNIGVFTILRIGIKEVHKYCNFTFSAKSLLQEGGTDIAFIPSHLVFLVLQVFRCPFGCWWMVEMVDGFWSVPYYKILSLTCYFAGKSENNHQCVL
jgi:hypothetical protein